MGQSLLRARSSCVPPIFAGIVPVFTLPGDRMFQSTVHTNVRPVILHAYGGAKVHMESALQTLPLQGWIPMASALVGTDETTIVGNP